MATNGKKRELTPAELAAKQAAFEWTHQAYVVGSRATEVSNRTANARLKARRAKLQPQQN